MPNQKKDLLQGTLDLLILSVLTAGPNHGYSIARRIELVSKDALKVNQGSLYPALHRLVTKGWIEAEWGTTETKRKARIYNLTKTGQAQIKEEVSSWHQFSQAVTAVLGAANLNP